MDRMDWKRMRTRAMLERKSRMSRQQMNSDRRVYEKLQLGRGVYCIMKKTTRRNRIHKYANRAANLVLSTTTALSALLAIRRVEADVHNERSHEHGRTPRHGTADRRAPGAAVSLLGRASTAHQVVGA